MSRKIYTLLIAFITITLLLTACERPASIAPATAPTSSSEIPFPVATQPQIMRDILSATQTAAAASGTQATGGENATSTPAFTFVTPTSAAATTGVISLSTSTVYATSTNAPTATPTHIVYPTPTPGKPATYTVQKGEFPYCLARRFNVNPADMLAANGLSTYSVISVGDTLTIPQSGTWPGSRALKSHPAYYTVVTGDTLGSIACGYGDADPNTILAANGLTSSTLTTGQVLYIP
jgi:LysM repeat protein